jgi:hypothetical protein
MAGDLFSVVKAEINAASAVADGWDDAEDDADWGSIEDSK